MYFSAVYVSPLARLDHLVSFSVHDKLVYDIRIFLAYKLERLVVRPCLQLVHELGQTDNPVKIRQSSPQPAVFRFLVRHQPVIDMVYKAVHEFHQMTYRHAFVVFGRTEIQLGAVNDTVPTAVPKRKHVLPSRAVFLFRKAGYPASPEYPVQFLYGGVQALFNHFVRGGRCSL